MHVTVLPTDVGVLMDEYRYLLRRVGWVLVTVGALDIGYMNYCIANQLHYSSSLNIFAVIAGIFLMSGHLGMVRWVTWFSALIFTRSVLASLQAFVGCNISPNSLVKFDCGLDLIPLGVASFLSFRVFTLVLLLWVYMELRAPEVVEARVSAGHDDSGPPISAFILAAFPQMSAITESDVWAWAKEALMRAITEFL